MTTSKKLTFFYTFKQHLTGYFSKHTSNFADCSKPDQITDAKIKISEDQNTN